MSPRSFLLPDHIDEYCTEHSSPLDEVETSLIAATEALGEFSRMQLSPEQSSVLSILVAAAQAKLVVEVGTFTGYSSLAMARALGPGGRLICCDVSVEWTDIARSHWEMAGVADRIDLRIAPALETLEAMDLNPTVDFAFIDADKTNYVNYFEQLVPRLSERGILAVDNTLWGGAVTDSADTSRDTEALREFNAHAVADPRVRVRLLPVGDGLSLITRA
jgi:caffeoyl-CoA O-methyltransferase